MTIRLNRVTTASLVAALGILASVSASSAEPSEASLMAQTKISKADAQVIALAKVPHGTIKSAELEQEHGALVWSFDIATPKSHDIHEILVNAKTGKIVATQLETPTAQAAETAADMQETHKHKH